MIGWENSRLFLNQREPKTKPIVTCSHAFSRPWRRLHIFALNSDWFIIVALFACVVIGHSNFFGFGFTKTAQITKKEES